MRKRFPGAGWYFGTVEGRGADGGYLVLFDDGDELSLSKAQLLKVLLPAASEAAGVVEVSTVAAEAAEAAEAGAEAEAAQVAEAGAEVEVAEVAEAGAELAGARAESESEEVAAEMEVEEAEAGAEVEEAQEGVREAGGGKAAAPASRGGGAQTAAALASGSARRDERHVDIGAVSSSITGAADEMRRCEIVRGRARYLAHAGTHAHNACTCTSLHMRPPRCAR